MPLVKIILPELEQEHLESQYHCHKRQASVGQPTNNPNSISNLLNPISYREPPSVSISSPYHSSSPPDTQMDSYGAKRKLPGEWEDDDLNPFPPGFVSASAIHNGGHNGDMDNGRGINQAGIGMGYPQQIGLQPAIQQRPNIPMVRPIDESRLAEYTNYGSRGGSSANEFQGGYDESPSNSKIDAGSSDPESRYAAPLAT